MRRIDIDDDGVACIVTVRSFRLFQIVSSCIQALYIKLTIIARNHCYAIFGRRCRIICTIFQNQLNFVSALFILVKFKFCTFQDIFILYSVLILGIGNLVSEDIHRLIRSFTRGTTAISIRIIGILQINSILIRSSTTCRGNLCIFIQMSIVNNFNLSALCQVNARRSRFNVCNGHSPNLRTICACRNVADSCIRLYISASNFNTCQALKSDTLGHCIMEHNLIALICSKIRVGRKSCFQLKLEAFIDCMVSCLVKAIVIALACMAAIIIIIDLFRHSRRHSLYFRLNSCAALGNIQKCQTKNSIRVVYTKGSCINKQIITCIGNTNTFTAGNLISIALICICNTCKCICFRRFISKCHHCICNIFCSCCTGKMGANRCICFQSC